MKVLVIGANGMLGHDLAAEATARNLTYTGVDLPEVDITRPETMADMPTPDVVIQCAAYTRVDDAETDEAAAWRVNADGAGHVAAWCAERGVKLLHVSTDYVFNGSKGSPYQEEDPVAPLSVYGKSKLGGEEAVRKADPHAVIVRTQSLYGVHGRSFVRAILGQIEQGKTELKVVSDQVSAPTYTRHLAAGLLNLAAVPDAKGVVHVASRDGCSWHQFAEAIVADVGAKVIVHPMSASSLSYPAPRPAFSILDTSRYAQLTGESMPTWREGLKAYLQELG